MWAFEKPEILGMHLQVLTNPCGYLPDPNAVRAYIERARLEGKDFRYQQTMLDFIQDCPAQILPVLLRYFDEQGQVVARIDIPAR